MKFDKWIDREGWYEPTESIKYNESEINAFVNAMANPVKNANAINQIIQNLSFTEIRYQKPLSTLLNIENPRLQNALGAINTETGGFKFYLLPPKAGNLEIIHPPVIYDSLDKTLLHGKILHELQHAQDWVDPRFRQKMRPRRLMGKYSFDMFLYAKSLKEARAWGRELAFLMRTLGANQVIAALNRPPKWDVVMGYTKEPIFNIEQSLIPFAVDFLKNFDTKKESVNLLPTQQVQTTGGERRAASLTAKIIKRMLFRNFVHA